MNPLIESPMTLDRVAFFGRTLKEYTRFFDLDVKRLAGKRVLDCPGGASSFAAEAGSRNIQVVAVDPQYALSPASLYARGSADIALVMEKVQCARELFVWKYYPTVEALRFQRSVAWDGFCGDFQARHARSRYLAAELPTLPFATDSFDVALSGHFLFLYANLFSYAFHLAAVRELLRVSRGEVRVYPLQGPDAKPYPYLDRLRTELAVSGVRSSVRPVRFEFQRGSTHVLVLRK